MSIYDKKWAVGFKDRGMGHGGYAVVVARGESEVVEDDMSVDQLRAYVANTDNWKPPVVVVKCESGELAEYIARVHNEALGESEASDE